MSAVRKSHHEKNQAVSLHHLNFPNESPEYRRARNTLLEEEMELRRQVERVAAQRRTLPAGGEVPEDYLFKLWRNGSPASINFSELFDGKDTLALYSFMYGPERERPCPGCTHFLDALDGAARHAGERMSLWIVAKSPIARIVSFAKERGWQHLRLLSAHGNNYSRDYFGDSSALPPEVFKDGEEWDMPMLNVFRREGATTIRHFWGSELLYMPPEPGQEYRHNDLLDPTWNLMDVTPEGRGDFHPRLDYSARLA
jgi:predicted dithiol-disulfide oxidoreductase (DUF899 family)